MGGTYPYPHTLNVLSYLPPHPGALVDVSLDSYHVKLYGIYSSFLCQFKKHHSALIDNSSLRGAVGFHGLRVWPFFVLGFQVFHSQLLICRVFEAIQSMMSKEVEKPAFEFLQQGAGGK